MPLVDFERAREVVSEFDKYKNDGVKLYKDLVNSKMSLSERLEELDPTPRDEDGRPITGVDALSRHLLVKNIALKGENQVTVEKLMSQAEYLTPELILREVKAGMSVAEKFAYSDCIAATVPAKGATYHPLYIPDLNLSTARSRRGKSLGARSNSGQGGEFPVVSIRRREKDITVNDHGRTVEAAYGVVRDYGWSDFAVFLRLIGAQLAADKLQNIYDLGITGDGTVGPATDTFGGVAGTLAYTDLITNETSFDAPFQLTRILAPAQSLRTILALPQFQDPLSGWEFQKSGKMVTPMGARLKQVNDTPGVAPTGTEIVTLDHNFACKEIVNEGLSVEADKIINRKFEEAVISECSSFCLIADGAIRRIIWT